MARDLRVILIKLSDRLHNMRTLGAKDAASRRRIARETLEIYAPIAQRLGMNKFKAELQDLGFSALYPDRHRIIGERIRAALGNRREAMAQDREGARRRGWPPRRSPARAVSRIKSPWSIYSKMRSEHKSFAQLMDVYGFRVVVDTAMHCYMALGAVHGAVQAARRPLQGFHRHPQGERLPVAAHRAVRAVRRADRDPDPHRGDGLGRRARRRRALGLQDRLRPGQQRAGARARVAVGAGRQPGATRRRRSEFLENVKIDLFPDEVYLFTPRGEILSLPRNATALDFAYAVHTDVGNHAVAARVDKKLVPLRTRLVSRPAGRDHHRAVGRAEPAVARIRGDRQGAHRDPPVPEAPAARRRRRLRPPHARPRARCARQSLDAHAGRQRSTASSTTRSSSASRNCSPTSRWATACPTRSPRSCSAAGPARRRRRHARRSTAPRRSCITGAERGVLSFGNCCHPLPGDEIIGFLSVGQGHRRAPRGMPERAGVPQVARAHRGHRVGSRRRRRLPRRAAHRGRSTAPACSPRSRRRSPRPSRTSRTSNTWSATARAATLLFAIEVKRPQAPGRRDAPRAPHRRGQRRVSPPALSGPPCARWLGSHGITGRVCDICVAGLRTAPIDCVDTREDAHDPQHHRHRQGPAGHRPVFAGRARRQHRVSSRARSRSIRPPASSSRATSPRRRAACSTTSSRCAEAAGGTLADIVRVGIYLTDLGNFAAVNAVMAEYFQQPYPARSTIEVSGLPQGRPGRGRRDPRAA